MGHLLCRGLSQCPFFVFPTRWLWWGLNPRPSDYQADVLPPDQPAPPDVSEYVYLNAGEWSVSICSTVTIKLSSLKLSIWCFPMRTLPMACGWLIANRIAYTYKLTLVYSCLHTLVAHNFHMYRVILWLPGDKLIFKYSGKKKKITQYHCNDSIRRMRLLVIIGLQ